MNKVLKFGSLLGLMLTIYPAVMFFMGDIEFDRMKWAMGIGMVLWFVTAPFWINKKREDRRPETEEN